MMGKRKICNVSKSPLISDEGQKELYLYQLKKIASRKSDESRVPLTQLYNTQSFFYLGNECMINHPELTYAVIRFDIYRFKTVNEFCGWNEGDKILTYIAGVLKQYESETVVIGHLRADIFAMCIPFKRKTDLIKIVKNIKEKIAQYPTSCKIMPSFGICIADNPQIHISMLIDYANLALQSVKGKVYAYYAFYDPSMREDLLDEKRIENEISGAIKNHDLTVYIQPKVDMTNGQVIGGEALIRWIHPEQGIVYPDKFIPVLEKSGYIINVDIYIWKELLKAMSSWEERGIPMQPVSVNVSRLHAYQKNFITMIKTFCKDYKVNPIYIPLEVTESAFTKDAEHLFKCVERLQAKGFQFSMDDFGSGYSSLNMLKDEPVDEVKIDRSFVKDIDNSERSRIVVKNVIQMLHELEIDIIAEGVENKEQADLLISYGCTRAQGYYYYKPMPLVEFEQLLLRQKQQYSSEQYSKEQYSKEQGKVSLEVGHVLVTDENVVSTQNNANRAEEINAQSKEERVLSIEEYKALKASQEECAASMEEEEETIVDSEVSREE